jgi:hypothetical protein
MLVKIVNLEQNLAARYPSLKYEPRSITNTKTEFTEDDFEEAFKLIENYESQWLPKYKSLPASIEHFEGILQFKLRLQSLIPGAAFLKKSGQLPLLKSF